MQKSLILAVLAVSLVVSRAGWASPIWSFHAAEPSTGAELVGTCSLTGAGNCSLSVDGGPAFGTATLASDYVLTSTDFQLDSPITSGTSMVFTIDPALYSAGIMEMHFALHDDQGVAFAGVPDSAPDLSLLEGASVQFSVFLTPTPYLYSLCPSCYATVTRSFAIDALVPEPFPAALAFVGLSCLALARRLSALGTESKR